MESISKAKTNELRGFTNLPPFSVSVLVQATWHKILFIKQLHSICLFFTPMYSDFRQPLQQ